MKFAATLSLTLMSGAALAQQTASQDVEEVEVIGVTPSNAGGLDARKIAANVQSATSDELRAQVNLDLSEFLNRNFASVFVNQAQNNPLQPDVQFRGFVASPLLGLPQGVSVYQDGVRINEPFGDTVNWALIPESAIASLALVPGANPLFGLNTLGGALSVQTKTGSTHPGSRAEISAGSFGRINGSVETGGSVREGVDYFATVTYFDEDGWRDFSPSDALQFFGSLALSGGSGALDLSVNLVTTDLIGNGPAPVDLLAADREAIFTRPDITENDLAMVNLRGERDLTDSISLTGNLYARRSDIDTLNGDDSEFDECEEPQNAGFLCEADDGDEEVVEDAAGDPILADDALIGATVNRSVTEQDGYGGALQVTMQSRAGARGNQLIVGGSYDSSRIDFRSSTELGALDDTRLAVPGGTFSGEAFTDLRADVDHYSLYLTNTTDLSDSVAATVSARYTRSTVTLKDRLGTALNGDHEFDRLNPAASITYSPSAALGLYLGYSESNRIPTPVELTCADPDDPCRLPNAFLADPPLQQVVGKSWELGARGHSVPVDWHFGVFHTTNKDDIIFISAGALTNQGFFSNVGDTLRQGIETSLSGTAFERLDWHINYTYLEATFEDDIVLSSANNPTAVDGEVQVRRGDDLPLVPNSMLKAGISFAASDKLRVGASLQANSEAFFRGDEGNDADPISGHVVFGLQGEYRFSDRAAIFVSIDNVFDTDIETFGLFGEPDEVLGDEFDDPRFLGPGAPRAGWIGFRIEM